jgi:hypothetical protein
MIFTETENAKSVPINIASPGASVGRKLAAARSMSPDAFSTSSLSLLLVDDAIWEKFGPGATGVGWDLAFLGLARHLETNQPVDRSETQAWLMSDAGKAFISACSDDWCRASIADGTEEQSAEAAAWQTKSFYTGERLAER